MGILSYLKKKYAVSETNKSEESVLEGAKRAIEREEKIRVKEDEEVSIPGSKRQLREHNKLRDKRIYKTLKPIYDKVYAEESLNVIKERAKRDARLKYGRTKAQKRRDAIQNLTKGLSEMGDILGGKPTQQQKSQRKGSHKKSRGQPQRRRKDPFDFDFDFDFKL